MPGFVTVLGTYHELQGSRKRPRNINDPLYVDLITDLIQNQKIDFIFEVPLCRQFPAPVLRSSAAKYWNKGRQKQRAKSASD